MRKLASFTLFALVLIQTNDAHAPGVLSNQITFMVDHDVIHLPGGAMSALFSSAECSNAELDVALSAHNTITLGRLYPSFDHADTLAVAWSGETVRMSDLCKFWYAEVGSAADVQPLIVALQGVDGVAAIEKRPLSEIPLQVPNDPWFINQWGLNNTGQLSGVAGEDIGWLEAWGINQGGDVLVGVYGAGVRADHEELAGRVQGESGWESFDHETRIACIIGASTNNARGIAGINPLARIYSRRRDPSGVLGPDNLQADFRAMRSAGCRAINYSYLWGPDSEQEGSLVLQLRDFYMSNVLFVCPTANYAQGNSDQMPENSQFSFSVGGVRPDGQLRQGEDGSNWGSYMEVVAPSEDIYSCNHASGQIPYDWSLGNSFAAPYVVGVASLLLAEMPTLAADDLVQLLTRTARDKGQPGKDDLYGWGMVDAGRALSTVVEPSSVVHSSLSGGSDYATVDVNQRFLDVPGIPLRALLGKRHEVRRQVTFAQPYGEAPWVWGRSVGTIGFDAANPNFGIGYCEPVPNTVTSTGCTMRTWVYELIWPVEGWFPARPQDVKFVFSVVGSVAPVLMVSPSGPVSDQVTIVGTVTSSYLGEPLDNYVVEWSSGSTPTVWSQYGINVPCSTCPVANGTIGSWNTGVVPGGDYTIRTRATFGARSFEERRQVQVTHRSTRVAAVGGSYTAIQPAIDNWAQMGDTIRVSPGVYAGNLTLKETVQLIGVGAGVEIVGVGNNPVMTATEHSYPASIENVTIRHQPGAMGSNQEGVHLMNAPLVMRHCVVRDCATTTYEAAGIMADGKCSLVLDSVEVRDTFGGGGLQLLSRPAGKPTVQATNCTFRANHINTGIWTAGGGVRLNYSYAPLTGADTPPRFDGCVFEGNDAGSFWGTNGAGVDIHDSGRTVFFNNCTFVENASATPSGAGIYVYNSRARLENCTIARNRRVAPDYEYVVGGIVLDGANNNLTVLNCIIAFNDGPGIAEFGSEWTNTKTIANSVLCGHQSDPNWVAIGENVVIMDPAFCDTASGDYHLFAFSPAAAPVPPNQGYFQGQRIGAYDVGCVPSAIVTAASSDSIPGQPGLVVACPKGDRSSLVVTVDLDGPITRNIDRNEITLDAADCVDGVGVFDVSGFVEAQSDAVGPGYEATISHGLFGGHGVNSVDVLLNGHPLVSQAHFEIRSMDLSGDGNVNLVDFPGFQACYPSPPQPYNTMCDFEAPFGTTTLPDFALYGAHYNHSKPAGSQALNSEPIESNAGITLQFTEEFPTASSHRLYVDVGVENFSDVTTSVFSMRSGVDRLSLVEWLPSSGPVGHVLFTPVLRDGASELFFGLLVSESFTDAAAPLGRLVFDVSGPDPVEISEDDFVLTIGDVLLDAPDAGLTVATMGGVFGRRLNLAVARIYHDSLEQNFPNPFNPTTTLAFSIKDARNVNLTIYDVAGRRVRELVNEHHDRGAYKVVWDGQNDAGQIVASGVYFYKLVAGSFTDTKKMTILK